MVHTNEDLEGFLNRLERSFERLADDTYVVRMAAGQPLVALRLAPPLLVVRVDIGIVPHEGPSTTALYRRLLELNATSLVHSAFGLEGDRVVLAASLELESVDLNEIEAVLSDFDLALAEHVPTLHDIVQSKA